MKSKPDSIPLTPDFFERADIKAIEAVPHGGEYVLIYIKLIAASAARAGRLRANDDTPYTTTTLSEAIHADAKTLYAAMTVFISLGLARRDDSKTVIMVEAAKLLAQQKPKEQTPRVPYQKVIDLYNEICTALTKAAKLSEARKKAIRARFEDGYTLEDFRKAFTAAQASEFLTGQKPSKDHPNWRADFDWLLKDRNLPRVMEGLYDNKAVEVSEQGSFNFDAFERESVYSTPTI